MIGGEKGEGDGGAGEGAKQELLRDETSKRNLATSDNNVATW